MTAQQQRDLHKLEGRVVHVALTDGSRIDAVALVSAGRHSVWVFSNGEDAFLPVEQVIEVWEAQSPSRSYRSAA